MPDRQAINEVVARLSRAISLRFSNGAIRLFRNNVGNGYLGTMVAKLPNGNVVLRDWRRVQFGLCEGSSDKIGWRTVTITPDMVGQKIAQFVAIEEKTGNARQTKQQKIFTRVVQEAGGRAGVARSEHDAEHILYS